MWGCSNPHLRWHVKLLRPAFKVKCWVAQTRVWRETWSCSNLRLTINARFVFWLKRDLRVEVKPTSEDLSLFFFRQPTVGSHSGAAFCWWCPYEAIWALEDYQPLSCSLFFKCEEGWYRWAVYLLQWRWLSLHKRVCIRWDFFWRHWTDRQLVESWWLPLGSSWSQLHWSDFKLIVNWLDQSKILLDWLRSTVTLHSWFF